MVSQASIYTAVMSRRRLLNCEICTLLETRSYVPHNDVVLFVAQTQQSAWCPNNRFVRHYAILRCYEGRGENEKEGTFEPYL